MSIVVARDAKSGAAHVSLPNHAPLPDGHVYHFRIRLDGDTKDIALLVSSTGTCQIDPYSKNYTVTAFDKNAITGVATALGSAVVEAVTKPILPVDSGSKVKH